LQKINYREGAFTIALCELIKNYKYCKNDVDQVQNDADSIKADQPVIGAIKEALRGQLTSIASKRLSSEVSKLEDLSVEEQNLWRLFDNSDIYEFITGEPDCLPEFQFDWIEPCQLAAHLLPGVVLAHPRDFLPPQDQNKPLAQPAQPQAKPAQPPVQPAQPLVQPAQIVQPAQPSASLLLNPQCKRNLNQNNNQSLGQVVFNLLLTNMISALAQIKTTRSFIPALNKDAENVDAKPRP
jgi:hypothetical protein